jgi:hypothetical protein
MATATVASVSFRESIVFPRNIDGLVIADVISRFVLVLFQRF